MALQPPLLPEVERRHPGGQQQAREGREHQADVHGEHSAGPLAVGRGRAAAGPGDREERDRDRHHGQSEQPVARRAAPDQVGADDEPDEEVERAGPGSPGEALRAGGLADEEPRLGEPAEPDAPRAQTAGEAGAAQLTGVGDGGLAVGEERWDDEELGGHDRDHRAAARELGQLGRLPLEPLQLRGDDGHVDEHGHEDDAVRGRDVLLAGAHDQRLAQLAQIRVEPLAGELEPVERVRERGDREPGDAEGEEHRARPSAARRA